MLRRSPVGSTGLPALLFLGHAHFQQRYYGAAVDDYLAALRIAQAASRAADAGVVDDRESLPLLSAAAAYLAAATSAKAPDRHRAVIRALALLGRAGRLRGWDQTALYNAGRALQQLGLAGWAVPFYERALAKGGTLQREVACNLALTFRAAGAEELARAVLRAHCTV